MRPSSEPPPYDFPDGAEVKTAAGQTKRQPCAPSASDRKFLKHPTRAPRPFDPHAGAGVELGRQLARAGGNAAGARCRPATGAAKRIDGLRHVSDNADFPFAHRGRDLARPPAASTNWPLRLTERFGRNVRVETEIGAVEHTANAAALAERDARQKRTEELMKSDPFVQNLMREFGATIVPGSIKPTYIDS